MVEPAASVGGAKRSLALRVPVLARVEGEGALDLDIVEGRLDAVRLRIFEPPRFFEKLVEGRRYDEVPDFVARICGICPVAYQLTAVQAIEKIFGVDPGPWVADMRRLMYCGEWIQSHCLHVHLLAAPDLTGFADAVAMTRAYPEAVRRGVKLQALGNAIMSMLGGRSVHPVGVRIGGFSRAPSAAEAAALHARLREALPLAEELVHWTTSLAMPDVDQTFINVALRSSDGYAIEGGRIVSSDGLDIDADAYPRHFTEMQVPHSTALQARYDGRPYMVGPLARLNLNIDRVPFALRPLLQAAGVTLPSTNPYHAIVARAVEVMLAIQESIRLLTKYRVPEQPGVEVTPRAGSAAAMTEAPRGLLWQRWETDAEGRIVACNIVPPTSQNQARIEEDLRLTVERMGLDSPEDALRARCEQVIRNYDPCISCATHFLRLKVTRRGAR